MEIRRIIEPEIVTSILSFEDKELEKNVLNVMGCSKVEWVQFLEDLVTNAGGLIGLFGSIENAKIKGYIVALNCVSPPMFRHVGIGYMYIPDNTINEYVPEMLNQIRQWSEELGVKKIMLECENNEARVRLYSKFGFKVKNSVIMELNW
jgi:RimJ/RimL family protein N-acetyltransferase